MRGETCFSHDSIRDDPVKINGGRKYTFPQFTFEECDKFSEIKEEIQGDRGGVTVCAIFMEIWGRGAVK